MDHVALALEALTAPVNVAAVGGSSTGGWRVVRHDQVLAVLVEQGATANDPRAAMLEAVGQLGGERRQELVGGGLRRGRLSARADEVREVWSAPVTALRQ